MSDKTSPPDDLRIALYQEICNSYQAIEDFRTKLLGLLPLASGAGIFLMLDAPFAGGQPSSLISEYLAPMAFVGAAATLGLLIYDLRKLQLRRSLVLTGKEIEQSFDIAGQFSTRPHSPWLINDLGGAAVIYSAVIAGWVFFGLTFSLPLAAFPIALIIFALGIISVYFPEAISGLVQDEGSGKGPLSGLRSWYEKRPVHVATVETHVPSITRDSDDIVTSEIADAITLPEVNIPDVTELESEPLPMQVEEELASPLEPTGETAQIEKPAEEAAVPQEVMADTSKDSSITTKKKRNTKRVSQEESA